MEKFTASNGITNLAVILDEYTSEVVDALREFFQHERDQELGRWRWPQDPDYVVYGTGRDGRDLRVVYEPTFISHAFYREIIPKNVFGDAARAYFAAHPEPKPWHDAKPGEVWEVRLPLLTRACGVVARAHEPNTFVDPGGRLPGFSVKDADIRSARRIWPESADG